MDKFILEHAWLFYLLNTLLIILVGWLVRALFQRILEEWQTAMTDIRTDIERSCGGITDLYNKYNDHEHRLSHIEGEHTILSKEHRAMTRFCKDD